MRRIKIIGAGQLGSRHLQALHGVREPLEIHVIDPLPGALAVAKQRYEAVGVNDRHSVIYEEKVTKTDVTEVAIVATSSAFRRRAIESLLDGSPVKFLVLEKLLFDKQSDYAAVEAMLDAQGVRAWVNCSMRVMPVYKEIAATLRSAPVSYRVTGAQFGLVTNAIHYLDHVIHLTGCEQFEIDTTRLDHTAIRSKREGFIEFNGILGAKFADRSFCEVACYPGGTAPVVVEIFNSKHRYIVRESEGKLWHSRESAGWTWQEQDAPIPYQSQMTTWVVDSLLADGECALTPFSASVRTHLTLLNGLRPLVSGLALRAAEYPFT